MTSLSRPRSTVRYTSSAGAAHALPSLTNASEPISTEPRRPMGRLPTSLFPLLLALAVMAGAPGCAPSARSGGGSVREVPPPLRSGPRPERPSATAVWVDGHWDWTGKRYAWIPGRWEANPPGREWIPGHWKKSGREWTWVPGRWEP